MSNVSVTIHGDKQVNESLDNGVNQDIPPHHLQHLDELPLGLHQGLLRVRLKFVEARMESDMEISP